MVGVIRMTGPTNVSIHSVGWCNWIDLTMLLVKFLEGFTLICYHIMVGDPKACDTSPEVTREFGKGMQEAVFDDLPNNAKDDISDTQKGDVRDA